MCLIGMSNSLIFSKIGQELYEFELFSRYQIPEGRFCVDRELTGTVVLVGCLEDFIPKINDVSNASTKLHDICVITKSNFITEFNPR